MKLTSYLANVKEWDISKQKYITTKKRVVPSFSYVEVIGKELPSGIKAKEPPMKIHDYKTTLRVHIDYILLDKLCNKCVMASKDRNIYQPTTSNEELVEIIPGTEEEIETEEIKISYAENSLGSEFLKKYGFKRYENLETDEGEGELK